MRIPNISAPTWFSFFQFFALPLAVMLAGLVRASGELPKLQKRAVGTIQDEFVSQFTDLFPVMNVVGNPKENSKTMRLTR